MATKKLNIKISDKSTGGIVQDKEFYKSLTIQAAVATIMIVIGTSLKSGSFGLEEGLVLIGCFTSIYGRIRANQKIKQ